MEKLSEGKCEACREGAAMVTEAEMSQLMDTLNDWSVKQRDGVNQLEKTFKFKNFVTAMDFANKVGEAAEQEDHHPTIVVEWGKVTITWWTHKIDGLHMNDFIMAAKSDQIYG